jgi:hypothetical protein
VLTKREASVAEQEKSLAQMVADHNAKAAKFFFKNGKPKAGTPPEMTESMQAAGKRLEAWQKRLVFDKTPAVWRGKTREGTPMLVLYRTGGGSFDVQIGPDKTSMPPEQVAKVTGMTKAEVAALPNDSTPPKKRERADLDSPTVQVGDTISDSQGSMGPVISFEGETPVMGMEGENEGDVEPQTAVGGWKLEQKASTPALDTPDRQISTSEGSKPPAEAPKSQDKISTWEQANLDQNGRYTGPNLTGFPYQQGEHVPVTERYSAMLEHRRASRGQMTPKAQDSAGNAPKSGASAASIDKIKGAFEGLRSNPTAYNAQTGLPKDRRAAFLDVAESLIDDGVNTPKGLASALSAARPDGSLRKYSQALWNFFGTIDPSLTGQHDWQAVYAGIDAAAEDESKEPSAMPSAT